MTGPIVQPPYVLGGVHAASPVTTGWDLPPIPTGPVTELGDLDDVDTAGEASGDLLTYDGAMWGPAPPAEPPLAFLHTQNQPVRTVLITHGMPFDPAGITVVDGNGVAWDPGTPLYPSSGVVELAFDLPFTGTVHLS